MRSSSAQRRTPGESSHRSFRAPPRAAAAHAAPVRRTRNDEPGQPSPPAPPPAEGSDDGRPRAFRPARRASERGRVASVADIDLSDGFSFRKGGSFSQPRGAQRRALGKRYGDDDDDEDSEEGDSDGDSDEDAEAAGGGVARRKGGERPERGSAAARALLPSLPLPQLEYFASRRGVAATPAADAEPAAVEEEDLSGFEPSTSTRAAQPHAAAAAAFFSTTSWAALGAPAELVAALASVGAATPSKIQALAWTALAPSSQPAAASPHVLIADAAGSGKTLAYLAPLVARLRALEAAGGGQSAPLAPRCLILVPTSELAQQVLGVARSLGRGGAALRCAAVTGGEGRAVRTQAATLGAGVDILVATPGRVATLLAARQLRLDGLRAVVLDEADVLAGPFGGFLDEVAPTVDAIPPGCRVVLVTATLPEATGAHLRSVLLRNRAVTAVTGPGLHRPAGSCEEALVDCSGGGVVSGAAGFRRKAEALVRALAAAPRSHTLVFCNTLDVCRDVENHLKRRDRKGARFDVHALHAAVGADRRAAALASLASPPPPGGVPSVVVCTDRASRGIDAAGVSHVVLFDFPRDASEYVRRIGRTARGAATPGRATLLVIGRQVGLAKELMRRNERGEALPV